MILKLDGFIIVGVDEETDYSICDVTNDSNRRRTQDIVAFMREKKFAGGIRPKLQYTDRNAVLLLRLQGMRREQISHQSVCAGRDAASAHKVLRHTWDWRVSQP